MAKDKDGKEIVATDKYPQVRVEICKDAKALTVKRAMDLLGWQSEVTAIAEAKKKDQNVNEDAVKFGQDYFLTDRQGVKVRLLNNTRNRPWSEAVSLAYMQDILKKHWKFNGESILIGKQTGRVLSGQHRLIGLVFAEQERTSEAEKEAKHWVPFWGDNPVTMETLIVYGIDESPEVTRTIDNVKSRTLSDVIFTDTDLFGNIEVGDRKRVARYLEYAVKMLWNRTGEKKDAWTPKRTHSESLDFVARHPKLKECIAFINEQENKKKEGALSEKYCYPGHAAALLYMMGCSGTPDAVSSAYAAPENRPTKEDNLDWGNFKKAKMFWADVASEDSSLTKMRLARRPIQGDGITDDGFTGYIFSEGEDGGGSDQEKLSTLIKAWNLYNQDLPIENLELAYEKQQEEGQEFPVFHLKEYSTIKGGIDFGDAPTPKKKKEPKEETEGEGSEGADEPATPVKKGKKSADADPKAEWEKDKKAHPEGVLFYRTKTGNNLAYFDDATKIGGITGNLVVKHPAIDRLQVVIGPNDFDAVVSKLAENGIKVTLGESDGSKMVFSEVCVGSEPEVDNASQGESVTESTNDSQGETQDTTTEENTDTPDVVVPSETQASNGESATQAPKPVTRVIRRGK